MELIVALAGGLVAVALMVGALAVWRIGRVASWRALAMTARATGSFTECVAFIRFCAEEGRERGMEARFGRPPVAIGARSPAIEEMPRAS